ncbi:MAG: hypothetical protein WCA48_00480, partial [Pseudomonas gingeri]
KYDVLGRKEDVDAALSRIQRAPPGFALDRSDPDFYILVGGDGVISYEKDKRRILDGKPILRVRHRNKGPNPTGKKSLGFTADVTMDDLPRALEDVAAGRCFVEKVGLLDCFIGSEKKGTAIYDIAVAPARGFSPLLCKAYILAGADGNRKMFLPSPQCDRVIVSTRYGSTAWNLSVGGAINLDADDCTHLSFANAPLAQSRFVYKSEDSLHLEIRRDAMVGIDGDSAAHEARAGSTVRITRSGDFLCLLRTEGTYEDMLSKVRRQHAFMMDSVV